jgi:hypothetical protein
MLNYNLNIIEPLKQDKKNTDVRPEINWDFHSFASGSDNPDNNELGFASMSINAIGTNCVGIAQDAGNSFVTDAQSPVTASITGSNWPVTGSTTMSLYTAGITYDPASTNQFFFGAISASAAQIIATPNVTGSVITSSFLASDFYRWYISGSIIHRKGNIYNPFINWKQTAAATATQDLETDTTFINGNSSSFNIVKDANVAMVSIPYASSSNSGSFKNEYAFNITSSLTASILPNTTGSVTMSLEIPEIGFSTSSRFFNTTSTGIKILSASFTASNNNPYNITASIINNKGNLSNADINWSIGVTTPSASFVSASFIINSDSRTIVSKSFATASQNGTYKNDYAFNQTASLYGSDNYWDSSYSFKEYTMSLSIPKLAFFTQSYSTNGRITASFVENTLTATDIIAGIELKPWTPYEVEIIAVGGGGAGGGTANKFVGAGGGAAGGYVSASWSIPVSPVLTYFDITIGAGGTCLTGSVSGSNGSDTTLYWNNTTSNVLIAKGGGGGGSATVAGGGSTIGSNTAANDGGSGAGGTGGGNRTITLPSTNPLNSTYAFTTGSNGANGIAIALPTSPFIASIGGGGGGASAAGQQAAGQSAGAGGAGANSNFGTFAQGGNGGSFNTNNQTDSRGANGTNASANTGNGGGGAIGGTLTNGGGTDGVYRGGNGGSGIVIIRYKGPQVATGGNTITTADGYTTHTFTSNGQFYPTANFRCCV